MYSSYNEPLDKSCVSNVHVCYRTHHMVIGVCRLVRVNAYIHNYTRSSVCEHVQCLEGEHMLACIQYLDSSNQYAYTCAT